MKPFPKSNMGLVKMIGSTMAVMVLAASFATPAFADREGGRDGDRREGRQDRQVEGQNERQIERREDRRIERRQGHQIQRAPVWRGDIRHFERHDLPVWRGGAWRHTRHNGELAWWWVVGGMWYLYPRPVYPYPDPYMPPVVVTQAVPVETTPSIVVAPAASSQSWYYCESAKGYYPYTASCPEGWQTVPATPPASPSTVPAQ